MQADWLWGLGGGLLIGLAAALYLLVNGRIMGASGILGELVDGSDRASAAERLSFLAALVAVPGLIVWMTGRAGDIHLTTPWPLLLVAGFLVGLGTRLANGCTSGHGVCGLARGSWRSMVATATFMATAILTVTVIRHVVGA